MRTFDIAKQFEDIKRSATEAVNHIFPVEGKLRSVLADKVWVEDKISPDDYQDQSKVKMGEGTWGVPVYASLSLKDNATGKILDKLPKVRLFLLPKHTGRLSFIVGGNEYQVQNQLRLKPGAYTIRKQNGELKTQVNLAAGQNFDLTFDENSGVFKINKVGGGQANIPLYPILDHLGMSHQAMSKAWGETLAQANTKQDPKAVQKAMDAFRTQDKPLKDYFATTKISPETTKLTLGQSFDRVDGPMLLAASKKLLDVHMGRIPPEDRDSLAFKEIHGLEDFIKERIEKNKKDLARKISRNVDNLKRTKLSQIVNPGLFSSTVESFFTQDDKSSSPEQTNPLEMISGQYRATIMGAGGITSPHAITTDMRNIHPTHYGFIDPVHTPECYDKGTEVFTDSGWKLWPEVSEKDRLACRINGTMEFHYPSKLHKSHFSGNLLGVQNGKLDYLVTPNHRMFTRPLDSKHNSWRIELAADMHMRSRTFCTIHAPYVGTEGATKYFANVPGSNASINVSSAYLDDWAEFVGWFLSEGDVTYDESNSNYRVRISQDAIANPEKCSRIEALLTRLPWNWSQTGDKRCYALSTKQLASEFKDQGYCDTKYIPEEMFNYRASARARLMEGLLLGDGRVNSVRATGVSYNQQVFCTTSIQLAKDFERLAIGLGHSVISKRYEDKREERYLDVYEIRILQKSVRSARKHNRRRKSSDYYTSEYNDYVYCATVPGSLLLVRRNGSVPIWLGNSDRIGTNLHIPLGARKDGKELKSILKDMKTGAMVSLNPAEAFDAKIAFPGQKGDQVKITHKGQVSLVPRNEAQYETPSPQMLFSWSSNMVPYLPTDQGNRAMMAAKMLEQAISLKHREAPLVQVSAGPKSMEKLIGESNAIISEHNGVVKKVTPDKIVIKTSTGDVTHNLYNNFSLNRKSFLHHESRVKEGDKVKSGDLLADSNFTRGGTLALGVNLKTAYIPYKGYNFEDGIVITQNASEKLTSEHIYRKSVDLDDQSILSLNAFKGQYPNAIAPESFNKLGADGVIEKGKKVKQGDTLVALLRRRAPSATIGMFQKSLADRPKDDSLTWSLEDEGTVLDVQKSKKGITIFIKTEEPAKIGDKLAGRHGNKGIITKIIPTQEAPRDKEGNPVDIMLNPHGVISRINIGQLYEAAAGKVAKKTGQVQVVNNFSGENYLDTTKALLDKHDVQDHEELFDAAGKSLGQVTVGNPHILKLFKQSTGNFSVRQGGPGQAYDVNQQPVKVGGEEGTKSLDLLTVYSLLSHGARANLREMSSLKSNQNDEFWKALKSGQQLPPPKSPFVYDKFMGYLKGAGIDVVKDGTKQVLAPFTDKQVLKESSGEVTKPVFYRAKDMDTIKDGFFDPVKFGGFKGHKWGHITLHEPVINPVFENAVRKVTGLGTKFDAVMNGQAHIDIDGKLNTEGKGVTGGAGIKRLLDKIDVKKEIRTLSEKIKTAKGAILDDMNKKIRYLQALDSNELTPSEAYIRKQVPVVPPIYRPIYALPSGDATSSDINFLYQNVGVLNTMMKLPVMSMLPDEEKSDIRKDMYQSVKALSGLKGDHMIKGRPREGFISEIKGGEGGQPKEGFFISKLLSKRQDFVGRGTIIPEPSLGIDQIAVPEQMAWKMFEPFIIRELSKFGLSPNAALDEIKNKTSLAKRVLDTVMRERTVMLNRAPSLHKFSVMAFRPTITQGKAIKIPPLVVKGFNADFDGDTMTVHMPITDEAVQESMKMLPSQNLYQPGTNKLMTTPSQESQLGIFYLSQTPEGRQRLNKILGSKFAVSAALTKGSTVDLLTKISRESPKDFPNMLHALKELGDDHAYERGFTVGIGDLASMNKQRDAIVKAATTAIKGADAARLKEVNEMVTKKVDDMLDDHLKGKGNAFYDMVHSGARGDKSQLRSILVSPLFVSDSKGRTVPTVIGKSYSEGLDIGDYWVSLYGARRGMMDRSIQTQLPGAFSKSVMASTIDNVISAVDCGTKNGIMMSPESKEVLDRYLAGAQGGFPHNTLVDSNVRNKLKSLKEIKVRSPLTCLQPKGTCAKCYGLDEHGEAPHMGDNIGAKAGQAISEPLMQMVMNTFHTGGVAGTGMGATGIKRVDQLLKLPKIVSGSATLAPATGRVTKIEPGIGGGFEVFIGDKQAHVAQGLKLKVKQGDDVAVGDALSEGVIKPQDLVGYKGMRPAQNYIVNELHKAYKDQKVDVQRKIFETVVRSLSNTTVINNKPRNMDLLPGDVMPFTVIEHHNANLEKDMPLDEALSHNLAIAYGPFPAGAEVDTRMAKMLKSLGTTHVKVKLDKIEHTPILKNIDTLPLLKKDWMGALGYRNLAKALTEGASQAWGTDIHDYHPVPALAFGAEFGKGKEGKY